VQRFRVMKVVVMQPYFFPYLGYFGLIKHSDRFIISDVVQTIKGGWIARNRILKPGEGWQYIQVPLVKHSYKVLIKDVQFLVSEPWQVRILNQLVHYKQKAPYYKEVIDFLKDAFSYKTNTITDLNAHLLTETCQYIGIPFCKEFVSDLNVTIEETTAPDELGLNVCKAIGADTYINPPGGIEFYDRNKYADAGVNLHFLKVNLKPYNQGRKSFEEGLSIIDVMLFNSPQEIQMMLDDYQLL
jgi:hypothetical protein